MSSTCARTARGICWWRISDTSRARSVAPPITTSCSAAGATMPHYLSAHELGQTAPAELDPVESPIRTRVVSNGEYNPLPQTAEQRRVEARITQLADELSPRHGLSRRAFLASSAGMAAAF